MKKPPSHRNGVPRVAKKLSPALVGVQLAEVNADDITTWKKDIADLTGIQFAGVGTHWPYGWFSDFCTNRFPL